MEKSIKYRIAWVAIYIALGLFGFIWNNEYWVSVLEGVLYFTTSKYGIAASEYTKITSDIVFLIGSSVLVPVFLRFPSKYGLWVPITMLVVMVILLLLYLPTSYDQNPGLYG